jgi:hypothetical protein
MQTEKREKKNHSKNTVLCRELVPHIVSAAESERASYEEAVKWHFHFIP